MNYFTSFDISASGLVAERLRLEAVATNLANANTTSAPGSAPYQAVRVISRPIGAEFARYLGASGGPLPAGVQVTGLEKTAAAPRLVYDPNHPDADGSGFVAYANVDPLSEMVTMMAAVRAYEANIKAISAAKVMAQKALEIGDRK